MNYKLLLCTSDHSSEKELNMSAMLRANKVDGVLIYSQVDDPESYMDYDLPVVSLDKAMPGLPTVICDNSQGGAYAVKTLIESGSVHPVIFGFEDMSNPIGLQRISGYREECVRRNVEYREYLIEKGAALTEDIPEEYFRKHFNEMLQLYPDTDGIFVTNEIIAIMALRTVKEMGRQVPQDLQIVGYDGTYLSKLMNLTTVAQPTEQLCSIALDILFRRMEGTFVPSSSILPVSVIRRGSTRNA
jgi:DNA-binding LacI/PurR family transcriptional regulator